jgi:predicted CoA-binding protein
MKTLVIGASENPARYANMAIQRLRQHNHEVVALGLKDGEAYGVKIQRQREQFKDIHTVTLYLNAQRQKELYDYILGLKPKRIVFNPGAENPELVQLASKQGIECVEACTLVMLSIGNFETANW